MNVQKAVETFGRQEGDSFVVSFSEIFKATGIGNFQVGATRAQTLAQILEAISEHGFEVVDFLTMPGKHDATETYAMCKAKPKPKARKASS